MASTCAHDPAFVRVGPAKFALRALVSSQQASWSYGCRLCATFRSCFALLCSTPRALFLPSSHALLGAVHAVVILYQAVYLSLSHLFISHTTSGLLYLYYLSAVRLLAIHQVRWTTWLPCMQLVRLLDRMTF